MKSIKSHQELRMEVENDALLRKMTMRQVEELGTKHLLCWNVYSEMDCY